MTMTVEQHTKEFIEALRKEDKESLLELPNQLSEEDKKEGLLSVIVAIKADAELAAANEDILKVLEAARDISALVEEGEVDKKTIAALAADMVDEIVEETEPAVVAETVKEEAEEDLPAA